MRMSLRALLPAGAGVLALALLVTGCSGPSSAPTASSAAGQSAAHAQASIRKIPGVESATVKLNQTMSGFNKHDSVITHVTLAQGTTVPDPSKLIDHLVAVSWSVNGERPDNGISLTLATNPQIDVGPVARDSGWPKVTYFTNSADPDAPRFAGFSAQSLTEKLGAWPGKVPTVESGLVETNG
jgi:hypothetical protein